MTESSDHPYVDWLTSEARRPVTLGGPARDRVMEAVRAAEPPRRERVGAWSRFMRPRVITISPAQVTALAAALVGIIALPFALLTHWDGSAAGQPTAVTASARIPASDTVVKFVFFAPQAGTVSVVGDFNDWRPRATPMHQAANHGVWSVTLPLSAGRHLYAFVVDGNEWIADPRAPIAPDDGFGHANSVVLVSRRTVL